MSNYYVDRSVPHADGRPYGWYISRELCKDINIIIDQAEAALDLVEACISYNSTHEDDASIYYPGHNAGTHIGYVHTNEDALVLVKRYDDIYRTEAKSRLNMIVKLQRLNIRKLRSGKATRFCKLIDGQSVNIGSTKTIGMEVRSLLVGVQCDGCGQVVSESAMAQHLKSLKCLVMTTNRDLRDNGYVEISNPDHVSTLKKAMITNVEIRPSRYSFWVPQHISEAINTYSKSVDDSGKYCGMTMAEYLNKMFGKS